MTNLHLSVKVDALCKQFPGNAQLALNQISTQIHSGQITGLVGPDGAGKTTLIRLICGLLQPTAGRIQIYPEHAHQGLGTQTDAEAIHRITGYMPQKFGLYEDLSVIENLRLYADLRDVIGTAREMKFKQLLQFTDLDTFQTRLAKHLSGGMKQKLGLACALIGEPQLLLLDEPSVGVDPISRQELWRMVQHLLKKEVAVIWSTAYLDEAEKCDQIILLNGGKTLYQGPPALFLKNVQGRVFQIQNVPADERRVVLMKALQQPEVTDGVIQGKMIRVVLGTPPTQPDLTALTQTKEASWCNVPPRFEDAFVDSLGGKKKSFSALAAHIPMKPQSDKPVIEAQGLTKCFGAFTAVSDIAFSIPRGEIFGLLGPNGAGKSTTFKMMCGLLQPTKGHAFIMGLDLKTAPSQARSRVGYMAQKFSLYGNLSVLQNLRFFSRLYGLTGRAQQAQIERVLSIFEFKPYLKQNAHDLPLGFKQRLALACAVMHEPDVLFLDEPTSGVDPLTRREFWTHINGMVSKGVTIMVTTHFMDEAEYCDRIALIYKGKNIASGSPDDLKDQIRTASRSNPSLEDAFIALVKQHDIQQDRPS